ncbi:NAD(P)/FAD-dependent oxidoreductase [Nocardioides guangzhouensis]|uniref:NAD(P)/FAD-dependent oxidoreductase n=1 Tax=Nocardioides guangzhouensis TaxID=2497878 RepID=A0A4Q4Z4G6_9ACTN|nr:FAD/NAD(P)-binding oxidoreductase [Nocardioides guangzhouensis]RYP82573.1 NAD(P)/FAD-dependent oxidoreductase [Nocardioides guangzhouensis]
MKELVILGGGTAGTMVANKLVRRLNRHGWRVTVVDRDNRHVYQPGLLFVPFGDAEPARLVRPRVQQLDRGVRFISGGIERVNTEESTVSLDWGLALPYDQLVIATGTSPRPSEVPGMDGPLWQESVFDFYTLDGATALRDRLATFEEGRLVVHVTDLPIKCPVAPLEFTFLVDAWLRHRGLRDRVELVYVTPLPGAFTKPVASERLGHLLEERGILVEPDFLVEHVDNDARMLVSYDEREVPFDLLVTVPLNMGADFVARSGLGDELNHVPVDRHTFLAKGYDDIFAIGDANDIPTSKAGSVAHFSVDVFVDNFLDHIAGRPMTRSFDGHANCFVESGDGKAMLIDFNYDVEPLPGSFPVPGIGPLRLLEETHTNHLGKKAFEWVYWHVLLPGHPIPLPAHLSMAGKHRVPAGSPPSEKQEA